MAFGPALIVIDSQTRFLKCVFYNLAFIKQLCEDSSEGCHQGAGGLFDHVNETWTRTQVKGTPTNKKQCKGDIVDSVNLAHVPFVEDRAQCNCCFQIASRQGGGGNL